MASKLYRNDGGKNFADVSAPSGIAAPRGQIAGVAAFDFDGDGFTDLAIANDTTRNFLFRNRGDGGFDEVGIESGIALSPSGAPRGAMGIDAGDLDGDLEDDLLIGNFAQEMSALYLQSRPGLFVDEATRLGFGVPTLMYLTFGSQIADFDNDGRPDLALANGHIEPQIAAWQPHQLYAQPLQVFRNQGATFAEVPRAGRCAKATSAAASPPSISTATARSTWCSPRTAGRPGCCAHVSRAGRFLELAAPGHSSADPPYGLRVVAGAAGEAFAAVQPGLRALVPVGQRAAAASRPRRPEGGAARAALAARHARC